MRVCDEPTRLYKNIKYVCKINSVRLADIEEPREAGTISRFEKRGTVMNLPVWILYNVYRKTGVTIEDLIEKDLTADRKTDNSSEKPNNYCDDCLYTDTCDSKEFFYACTSKATISKMEQVEDEPQIQLTARCLNCNNAKACKENHWEGCVYEPKDEKNCETCRHWKYIAKEWQCEACKCQGYESRDEPQTERRE